MQKNKLLATISLIILAVLGASALQVPPKHKNLQVLPKDISDEKLDSIMNSYNKALGVSCDFCHEKKKIYPGDFDYAADNNPMKTEARRMMRLTIQLNKEHFYYDTLVRPEYLKVVTCNTCHRGEAFPAH